VFGNRMSPNNLTVAMHVGTAAGSIVIGLLVLANQNHPLGQIIGLFTFDGGITLVELLAPHGALPVSVSAGVSLAFLTLVLTCGQYLNQILAIPPGTDVAENREVL
jgi:hydrogenase-4 membrane subunit HyfE